MNGKDGGSSAEALRGGGEVVELVGSSWSGSLLMMEWSMATSSSVKRSSVVVRPLVLVLVRAVVVAEVEVPMV